MLSVEELGVVIDKVKSRINESLTEIITKLANTGKLEELFAKKFIQADIENIVVAA